VTRSVAVQLGDRSAMSSQSAATSQKGVIAG
jgi:hypothetical protein